MEPYVETYGEEPDDSPKTPNIEQVALTTTKTEKTHTFYFIDSTHFEELHGIDPRYAPSEVVKKYVLERQGLSVPVYGESSNSVERVVTHTITSCPSELRLPGV